MGVWLGGLSKGVLCEIQILYWKNLQDSGEGT